MNRRSILAFAGMMAVVALAAIPASAGTHTSSTAQKVYRSWKCNAPVKQYDFASWACATVTVPTQANAGDTATVTFTFKAKTKLRSVDVCFGKINAAKCAFRHKYATINRGSTVKRVLKLSVPNVAQSGTYSLDNYTRFYKLPKYASREAYWAARSFVCIVVDGDSSACTGGR